MRKYLVGALFLTSSLMANQGKSLGVVNFATCISESKHGKKEQEALENLRTQMASMIEGTEKELKEIALKFEDSEYLDMLSPKAEEDLKVKYQTLQEDLGRYQNQFYQVLNHANYQMVQKMSSSIADAAAEVAKEQNLSYVLNKEACFYVGPEMEVTSEVISKMNRKFDSDEKASKKKLSDNSEDLSNETEDQTR